MYCFLGLLSFFPLPHTVCLGFLKQTILSLKLTRRFLIGSKISLINQSYQVFLIGLIFLISFFEPIHLICRDDNWFEKLFIFSDFTTKVLKYKGLVKYL